MQSGAPPYWRTDVQGLRAVAVVGVLVFHAGAPWLTGGFAGVDVFFVVSGFLITRNLLRERATTGTIRLGRFFLGRLVRLAPAATATVLATVAAVFLVLPPLDRVSARPDALFALLGLENLHLARTGTDYLAEHAASPFQQFWSLGVEEQFYVGWAVVLVVLSALPRLRSRLLAVTFALGVLGFGVMLAQGALSGPWAFFGSHTRAWEFLAGALVAMHSAARTSSPRRRGAAAWHALAQRTAAPIGLVLIGAAFVLFDAATPYPGPATLVPVLGAALLVAPGVPGDRTRSLLGARPLRWIGDRSYSLYLWHWPAFLLPTLALGRPLEPLEVLLACTATVLVGWVSHAVFERGVTQWVRRARRRPLVLIGAVTAVAVVTVPLTALPPLHAGAPAVAPDARAVLAGPLSPPSVPSNLSPSIADVSASLPVPYRDGCHADTAATVPEACAYGSSGAEGTVILFGDSHAAQWATPVIAAAEQRGMRVVTMTKSACPVADVRVRSAELGREYDECDAWRSSALARIAELAPDVVLVSAAGAGYESLRTDPAPFAEVWRRGLERTLTRITAPTVVLHDTPRWSVTPNRCLSASVEDVSVCSEPTAALVRPDIVDAERAAARVTDSVTVDPVPWICDAQCAPVLWNVLAYRDVNHITDVLARTLTPRMVAVLDDVLG